MLLACLALCLVGVARAATDNIDLNNKWAWGTNVGWINFDPAYGGVRVYDDHLEGYAWGTNVGWINFDPANGGVTIDMSNVEFDGYVWGENIGWIHLKGTAADMTRYKVVALLYRIYLPLIVR
jgi:hypothetical protein